MAQTIKWATPGTFTDLLTTELNSLGNGSGSNLGTEFDNRTNLYLFGDLVCNLSWGSNPTAGASCDIYLIPETDNTNYNDGSSTVRPANFFVGGFVVRAATGPQILTLRGLTLPPSKFKLTAYNNTGVAFTASGNKVSILPYNYQAV